MSFHQKERCALRKKISEKTKQCPYCEHKTRRNLTLHKHIDRKHGDLGGEKKFPCEICGKSFIYPESLKDHATVHYKKMKS